MSASVFRIPDQGNGVIATRVSCPVGDAYRIISVSCVFATAPITSENFTITLNSVDGPQFDVLLYTVDPSATATTDILWQPDEEKYLLGGDVLDIDFASTDGYAWTVMCTVKKVP